MEDHKFPREIALCLSGGVARGAFHLGAISVLEEAGIEIKAISGASIGALIGASIGCGKSAKEIFEVIKSKEFKTVFKYHFFKGYLFELDQHARVVDKLINITAFEKLFLPLTVCVCDVEDESALYFNSGESLKDVVLASCSLAPLFKPVKYKNRLLIDGGAVDNFPVEQLQQYNYPIVGINLYPKKKKIPISIFGWLKWLVHTGWQSRYHKKADLCDFYLCPAELNNIRAFSFKDLDKAYALGQKEMKRLISLY